MSADAHFTRRQLLIGGAAATGYALAAGPVEASAIETTSAGLDVATVEIPVEGGPVMRAYRAAPVDRTKLPVVLVVHEIFGVHAYIEDVCRRFAHAGYLAIAPDLYRRAGDAAGYADIRTLIAEVVSKVPDETVLADLDAARAYAAGAGGDAERTFVTGFCWGGRIVWLYAAHRPEIAAGAAWYGRLEGEASEAFPRHPVALAGGPMAPVLGLYGSADTGIPMSSVQAMRKKLAESAQASEILVFPGAPHGFHADYRPSFREMPAREGWRRALSWFASRGGVPTAFEAIPPTGSDP